MRSDTPSDVTRVNLAVRAVSPSERALLTHCQFMGRLEGKVAIVTGAAMGQGAAIARRFAAEGAEVVLADVADAEGKTVASDIGSAATYINHDVTDESSWQEVVRIAHDGFGSLDVLVNNAGIIRWA